MCTASSLSVSSIMLGELLWVELCSPRSSPPHLSSSSSTSLLVSHRVLSLCSCFHFRTRGRSQQEHYATELQPCAASVRQKLNPLSSGPAWRGDGLCRLWGMGGGGGVAQVTVGHQPRLWGCCWSKPVGWRCRGAWVPEIQLQEAEGRRSREELDNTAI